MLVYGKCLHSFGLYLLQSSSWLRYKLAGRDSENLQLSRLTESFTQIDLDDEPLVTRAGRTEHCEDGGVLSWFRHQTVDSQILINKLMVLPVLSLICRVHDLVGLSVALEIFDSYHDTTVISKVEEVVLLKNLQDLVYKLFIFTLVNQL